MIRIVLTGVSHARAAGRGGGEGILPLEAGRGEGVGGRAGEVVGPRGGETLPLVGDEILHQGGQGIQPLVEAGDF